MGLDIRLPVGLFFSILGLLLTGFGAFSEKEIYQRSLGLNVNLAWGIVLLVFGIAMFILGRLRTQSTVAWHPGQTSSTNTNYKKKL